MKSANFIKSLSFISIIFFLTFSSCNEPIYDFGYDGELSGNVKDNNGNPISGDLKLATFAVQAQGENDLVPMVIRIKGNGTYANIHLYPQLYKVKLVGPFIESPTAEVSVDLTGGKAVTQDFQVTPLLTIPPPSISGSPASSSVTVNYSITGNGGNTPDLKEIYCSTVSWPTRTTGNGAGYRTVTVAVTEDQGTINITDLEPNKTYFIRVGARAAGQNLFNHSEQISFTTPAN